MWVTNRVAAQKVIAFLRHVDDCAECQAHFDGFQEPAEDPIATKTNACQRLLVNPVQGNGGSFLVACGKPGTYRPIAGCIVCASCWPAMSRVYYGG